MSLSKQYSFPHPDRGSVLIICMWVLVFFAILSAGLFSIISSQIKTVRAVEDRFFSQWLARSAAVYAQNGIKNDQTGYDTLFELRQDTQVQLGLGRFVYELIDQESRININTSSANVIARLPGFDLSLAEDVMASALRPFHIKEEVLSVEGVSRETFDKFKDFITVHSSGRVNINTAPAEVLEALGMDESLVSAVCEFRKGPDGEEATEDDGIFQTRDGITETLNSFRSLSLPQVAEITNLVSQDKLAVEGENFCLAAQAYIIDRPAVRYEIIMDKDKIEEWREY